MKQLVFLISLVYPFFKVFSQDPTITVLKTEATKTVKKNIPDTLRKKWVRGGLLNVNISQGSLSNWAAGGDKFALSANLYANGHAFYKKNRNSWDNNIDVNLGYINTTSLGGRKNDDRIDFLSKYAYAINKNIGISGLVNFRSQFFNGYTYPDSKTKVYSSAGFAPAYILLSPGFNYSPIKNFSVFLSPVTTRFVVVGSETLSAKGAYGVDTGKNVKTEVGAFGTVNLSTSLTRTVSYKGRIDLFSNYKHNPFNIDLYMTNIVAAKITKILTATWSVDMIYDDDVRIFGPKENQPRLQVKSQVGVGLLIKKGV